MVLTVPFKVFAYSFYFMVWTVAQRHDFMHCAATICIYVSMYVYVCIYSIYTHTTTPHLGVISKDVYKDERRMEDYISTEDVCYS